MGRYTVTAKIDRPLTDDEAGRLPSGWSRHTVDPTRIVSVGLRATGLGRAADAATSAVRGVTGGATVTSAQVTRIMPTGPEAA